MIWCESNCTQSGSDINWNQLSPLLVMNVRCHSFTECQYTIELFKRGMWRKGSPVTKKSNSHLYYTKVGAFWHLISFFKSNYEKVAYFHRYLTFKNAYLHYSKCDLRWARTYDPLHCCETKTKNYNTQARTADPVNAKLTCYQYAITTSS